MTSGTIVEELSHVFARGDQAIATGSRARIMAVRGLEVTVRPDSAAGSAGLPQR
jgi:hypothetical protein